jgi:tRNA uridine 5-carbamoylmethylation protein Kti12
VEKVENKPAKHICLWGAPGTGKSTIAAGVFYEMKKKDYDVELVQEYAKDLVFSKDFFTLKNQLYIFARQSHPWYKLDDQVDYVVHDSPFLMGLIYAVDNRHLPLKEFTDLVVKSYKNYDTLNIFLLRNPENRYTEHGRMQSEDEAYEKQNEIAKLLLFYDIPHIKLVSSENTVQDILALL